MDLQQWVKHGLIYVPSGNEAWRRHSFLTPTPLALDNNTCRVYGSVRDDQGRGRIAYVDVDAKDPRTVLGASSKPCLDLGAPGTFDDAGSILGDVLWVDDEVWLYTVGFQLVSGVKFLAFTGLSVSRDGGETFTRCQETPVLDRTTDARYIRALHTVRRDGGQWTAWGAEGDGWLERHDVAYPRYDTFRFESEDGLSWSRASKRLVEPEPGEYRVGRPRVTRMDDGWLMLFTRGNEDGDYTLGKATSQDGINWIRDDSSLGLRPSPKGWDSEALCYAALWSAAGRTYAFYNGNGMGRDGLGLAEVAT